MSKPPFKLDPPVLPKSPVVVEKKPSKWQQFKQAVGEAIGNAKFGS